VLLLRSALFNVLFGAWTCLAVFLAVFCLPLPSGAIWALGRLWVRGALALLAAVVGLRHRTVGLAHRANDPAIYAVKHQSAWDTLIFILLLERPAFVLKRELLAIPFFGWCLARLRMIPVDRKGRARALKRMVAAARNAVREGRPILIYPEGTRVRPGERRPYLPGVAALYGALGLPVVPVALNSGLFWGRRSFRKRPGVITLEFLPPIPPGLPRTEFMGLLENRIETVAARMAAAGESSAGGAPGGKACG
jgi:1-acyl-sn-glycerol-3-phosphate acyltransferase